GFEEIPLPLPKAQNRTHGDCGPHDPVVDVTPTCDPWGRGKPWGQARTAARYPLADEAAATVHGRSASNSSRLVALQLRMPKNGRAVVSRNDGLRKACNGARPRHNAGHIGGPAPERWATAHVSSHRSADLRLPPNDRHLDGRLRVDPALQLDDQAIGQPELDGTS